MKKISGVDLFVKSVEAQGIRYIFTVPTERLTPLIEALESRKHLEVVRARNETAATIMADGYMRRSKRYAAVLTDDNGRALSQIAGVTNAWADKVPLISFSLCSDEEPDYNKGADRSRFDQNGVFHAVTLWRKRVSSLESMPGVIEEGMKAGSRHKMGPMHIDIPAGILDETVSVDHVNIRETEAFVEKEITTVRLAGDDAAVSRAVSLITNAKKPLLFYGAGIKSSEAQDEALQLLEELKIPVATTMAGLGTVPADHECCLGGPSYTAGEVFHVAIKEADVVIAIGAAFSGLEGFGLPPIWSDKIKFIHVDIDPLQIGLNVHPEVSILGDARTVLIQLIETLRAQHFQGRPEWGSWRSFLFDLKKGRAKRLDENANKSWPILHQGKVVQELSKMLEGDDLLLVIDGGNTPVYAAMYAPGMGPRQVFFPFGMAALGGGVPYAIGVQLASPDKRVVLLTGDGSFLYNVQELETIKRLGLPIVIIVNNDSAWNMIKAMQDSMFERNYVGTELPDVDYAGIARGFGLHAERVTTVEEIIPASEKALNLGAPGLIECITDSRNIPDSLLSFTMVEFEGVMKYMNPKKFLKSQWMMRDVGRERMSYQLEYIKKALLRINTRYKGK